MASPGPILPKKQPPKKVSHLTSPPPPPTNGSKNSHYCRYDEAKKKTETYIEKKGEIYVWKYPRRELLRLWDGCPTSIRKASKQKHPKYITHPQASLELVLRLLQIPKGHGVQPEQRVDLSFERLQQAARLRADAAHLDNLQRDGTFTSYSHLQHEMGSEN